mmetsp:Transcript_64381/g.76230  ORF Transcript_64381/g.76230 Transcript_64381/m.76230 type:complete len:134 (-) Transcript_64381:219-620(-)
MGVTTVLPPDNPQISSSSFPSSSSSSFWRPRIPVMSLPPNFESNLPTTAETDPAWGDFAYRTPEEGGNGISPLFWYEWREDEFVSGEGARMGEVCVFERMGVESGMAGIMFGGGDDYGVVFTCRAVPWLYRGR